AGGAADLVIGRVMDILFSFPTLILAIGIAAMLGPGLENASLAIAVVYAPLFSRVVRGPVSAEAAKEYALAALGLGAGAFRVVFRHILPNVLAPLIVQASVSLAYAILTEAALSYLGLGTQPPAPSWGTMLNEGRTYLETAPWMSIFPGIAIMLAVFGFNLLGDGLRAVMDPQLRGRRDSCTARWQCVRKFPSSKRQARSRQCDRNPAGRAERQRDRDGAEPDAERADE